uniref:Serine protease n=1 Tax=Rattus norvegicus TaxID=10116 RepID=Q63546_RAT|nr:serine protease [Rattus norvegicus]
MLHPSSNPGHSCRQGTYASPSTIPQLMTHRVGATLRAVEPHAECQVRIAMELHRGHPQTPCTLRSTLPCSSQGFPESGELSLHLRPYRTILLSVISLLNEPNTFSPANVDASVMYRKWKESKGKDREYTDIIR